MARLRILLAAAIVLALGSCQLLEQQENFISFTWDGVQYLFTASADKADHPYAVGYTGAGPDPSRYEIRGSASAQDALDGINTIELDIWFSGQSSWNVAADILDSDGYSWTYSTQIPEGMIDSFIENRDAIGEQFAGAMPGPLYTEGPELANVVFSVERLPNEEDLRAQ